VVHTQVAAFRVAAHLSIHLDQPGHFKTASGNQVRHGCFWDSERRFFDFSANWFRQNLYRLVEIGTCRHRKQ